MSNNVDILIKKYDNKLKIKEIEVELNFLKNKESEVKENIPNFLKKWDEKLIEKMQDFTMQKTSTRWDSQQVVNWKGLVCSCIGESAQFQNRLDKYENGSKEREYIYEEIESLSSTLKEHTIAVFLLELMFLFYESDLEYPTNIEKRCRKKVIDINKKKKSDKNYDYISPMIEEFIYHNWENEVDEDYKNNKNIIECLKLYKDISDYLKILFTEFKKEYDYLLGGNKEEKEKIELRTEILEEKLKLLQELDEKLESA